MLSIIVPTYNEKDNIFIIADRIKEALKDYCYEIIFVDDSKDETPNKLEELSKKDPHVRYEHRVNERGLGTAVVRGFELAQGTILTVMDADLQHPPEMLPKMIEAINSGADIVIPSRFIPGGDDGGLNFIRKLISATARYMGKAMLKSLRAINDPTSGFFMFRNDVIKDVKLQPIGWKILIEILARGNYKNVIEIPYRFQARAAGESKMSLFEQVNYIKHLIKLVRDSSEDRRLYLFAGVGLSGVIINMLIYSLLIKANVSVAVSGFISASIAMLSNFYLNDKFTWADAKLSPILIRFSKFLTTSILGILINVCVLSLLYYIFNIHYFLANLIGIALGTIWNYLVNNLWTWKLGRKMISKPFIIRWSEDK